MPAKAPRTPRRDRENLSPSTRASLEAFQNSVDANESRKANQAENAATTSIIGAVVGSLVVLVILGVVVWKYTRKPPQSSATTAGPRPKASFPPPSSNVASGN
jgi:hypothetical protein